ncbi:hypothetical protein HMPREF9714_00022 [Myroides odoratimimus CCUG 12901]|uniref:DUF5929 domain-containing protein n=1 Tax=Myroides TaxID=76831 RepID=UPI00024618BD|nr:MULTISPECIES: DUF5929 domain-containing protein [Myroides]EHO15265.1 hypothetical protein HMPREF9714_00022 [Myroides odoratimimus CCUG 12901]MCS7472709.1 ATP-binding protein [Myroides odoratimimus]WHT74416.1 DUF5929 domain-containing protein [Myroides odoratimimus]WHU38996.1 DUF5929 domain-containing protein [Myroides odoratimimus]
MINKRLLIKNLLAHYDENSFYDKKRQLNLHSKSGKAKFLKHICALANSNPDNSSYLLVGIEDEDNEIVGVDFYDDSKIQNLVNAYLDNPPLIIYDNVAFNDLPKDKVVGLVSIRSGIGLTTFKRSISEIAEGSYFVRIGSTSVPDAVVPRSTNREIVKSIEKNSQNDLASILDSVITFMTDTHRDMKPRYNVFREQFIICWAGNKKMVRGMPFYSRVDIEFVNEQIKLFYSDLDSVTIAYNGHKFVITEYLNLGLNDKTSYYPFEEVMISFSENGTYSMTNTVLFKAPSYNRNILGHIYGSSLNVIYKLQNNLKLTSKEERVLGKLCFNMMLCYLNGFEDAKDELISVKDYLKYSNDPQLFIAFKEVMRILRKLKYETEIDE